MICSPRAPIDRSIDNDEIEVDKTYCESGPESESYNAGWSVVGHIETTHFKTSGLRATNSIINLV